MALPAQITVVGAIADSNGPVAGRIVWHRDTPLYPSDTGDTSFAIPEEIETRVGSDGLVSQSLYSTDDPVASPTGWAWTVTTHFPHWKASYRVAIPYNAPGAQINLNQLLPVPGDGDGTLYAPVNHTHPGDGSVTYGPVTAQTAFGATSGSGSSDAVSRADHTHGTPAAPTPASIGASASGHTHSGVYDPAGAATAAVEAHEAALNPHPQYAGGGGGASATVVRGYVTTGDVSATDTSSAWVLMDAALRFSIAAVEGDAIHAQLGCLFDQNASLTDWYELVVIKSGAVARYASTGTSSPSTANEGDPAIYPVAGGRFRGSTPFISFVAGAGDISAGTITFGVAHLGPGGGKVFASADRPFRYYARNDHQ